MSSIYQIIEELREKGLKTALCTVVSTKGSTPLKAGAKMLVTESGEIHGTIGGGQLEKAVLQDAARMITLGETRMFEHNLLQQHGMCCGGTVQILIEAIRPPDRLYIFGSGHVGRALALFGEQAGLQVFVVDPRPEELAKLDLKVKNRLNFPYNHLLPNLPFTSQSCIAIMTYDHQLDRDILAACIQRPHGYLGMIGSRRKVEVTRKMFLAAGICTEAEINRVDMPMGYDVKGRSPEEIAIGILAKIIETKNKNHPSTSTNCLVDSIDGDTELERKDIQHD